MQPEGLLIETMDLKNGLSVHFYDQSVPLVGDRWQVKLHIMIPVEVKQEYFGNVDNPEKTYNNFISVVGKTVYFQINRFRNFIDHATVSQALSELKDEFLRSSLHYISRPHFARKFVLKIYQEHHENEHLKQLYSQHLQD